RFLPRRNPRPRNRRQRRPKRKSEALRMSPPCQGGKRAAGERGGRVLKRKPTARSPSAHGPLDRGPKPQTIGVIGLGIMGSAMAANLAKAGYRVHGYDIVPARRAALRKAGGTPQASIARVARAAEVLISSLPSAGALHAVAAELG